MIIIALLLIFSLFMFLNFEHKRKRRNERYRNVKKGKLAELLETLRLEDDDEKNNTSTIN